MIYKNILYSTLSGLLLFASCAQTPENAEQVNHLPNMYPDYADVTIPVNIAPLNFEIRNKHLCNIETILTIEGADENDVDNTLTATSNSQNLKFDLKEWKYFLAKAAGKNIKVQIYSKSDEGKWTAFRPFTWQVVSDSIDSYLTYQLIEPTYDVWSKTKTKQRCIENWDEKIIADYTLIKNLKMNTYAYGNQDKNLSIIYLRGENGGTILNRNGKLRKLNLQGKGMASPGIYYSFNPSGRYLTYSTNTMVRDFNINTDKRLEVYDTASSIYVADLNDNHIISSPLASDSSRLETFPTFSPNGKYIYYCAANKKELSDKNLKNLKYALVRIPFNEENGRFGERIDTLYSSRSVCHPKLSPDGRFCLFTVLDYGTFPAWHTESDLYMLDLQTGKTDSLNIVNSKKSDTYHCWSHTGRWFVFISKRDDGIYGKPYFCYIDRQGKAHKPFVLPQKEPSFYDDCLKSFNIPELSRGPVPFNTIGIEQALKQEAEQFR